MVLSEHAGSTRTVRLASRIAIDYGAWPSSTLQVLRRTRFRRALAVTGTVYPNFRHAVSSVEVVF